MSNDFGQERKFKIKFRGGQEVEVRSHSNSAAKKAAAAIAKRRVAEICGFEAENLRRMFVPPAPKPTRQPEPRSRFDGIVRGRVPDWD